jgi:hypothetical protein
MLKRVRISLCLLMMSVAGLTVAGAAPASAGLTPGRNCANFDDPDGRRLSVCARGWVADGGAYQWRGVVEMHSYILVNGHPVDVTAQSITVNQATFWPMNADGKAIIPGGIPFGQDQQQRCRVNSPTSSQITCSVPNTGRVAFYSPAFNGVAQGGQLEIYKVSWRDDLGRPWIHESGSPSSQGHLPLHFSW